MFIKSRLGAIYLVYLVTFAVTACGNDSAPIIADVVTAQSPTLVPLSDFQKGLVYTSWWHGEYSTLESDETLAQLIKPMGINWISVVVTCYQDTITSTKIECLPNTKTPTNADLYHVIRQARQLGLRVMLKPHVDLSNDDFHWRGEIGFEDNERAWEAWFASYAEFITHYARLAQAAGVDYFVIGTELVETSVRADQWRSLVKMIRGIYSGPITYAANPGEVWDVTWWDAVDAIGADAYYPLTQINHPTVAELKEAWMPIVSRMGQFSRGWARPIIFTEIGYRSVEGANQQPSDPVAINLQEQADRYQAVFEAFKGQAWWHGVFWWNWTPDLLQGGPQDNDFTANNKPAENILRLNYGAPLRDISTPAP